MIGACVSKDLASHGEEEEKRRKRGGKGGERGKERRRGEDRQTRPCTGRAMNTSNHVRRAACHWLNQARLATDAGHALVSATSTSSVVVIDGAKHAQSHEVGPQHGAKLSEGVGCRRYASASASVSGAEAMMKQKSSKFPVQTEEELHVKGEQLMGQSLRVTKAVDDPTHTDKWMQDVRFFWI